MREMETQALQETIPVVTPAVGNFLALLVQMSQPRNLLEIGTAIGYSTLWLARAAAGYGGKIVTIDLNQDRLHRAEAYFTRAGFAGQIEAIGGDARKILPNLTDTFDFVFLDAAKGEYLEYLDLVIPLIAPRGLLVVDNVLFRGWVVPGAQYDAKYNRMVAKMREFVQRLTRNPQFSTSILPLGDGVAVSVRK